MPEINQIAMEPFVVSSSAFEDAPETYFSVTNQFLNRRFTLEIEGRIQAALLGGGRIQFTGPSGATIEGHAELDNGPPVFFAGFGVPIGGGVAVVPNGNHKFRIWAIVESGNTPGLIQLQFALGLLPPGGASLTQRRTQIRAMIESASF